MPFPDIYGDLGSLAIPKFKIPKLGSARTPSTFPSNAGAGTALPPVPDPSADDGSQDGSGIGSNPPISPSLKQPPMTPGMQQEQILLDNPPAPAGGVRGKIGGVLNAIGWNWAGNPLKYPGLDTYQANLARAQAKAGLEDEAQKRQEAAARIENMRASTQAMGDYRRDAAQDRAQGTYNARMGNIEKAGGFEAPNIPPSLTTIPAPADASQPPSPTNLPQNNLILSPGLQPSQSARLGTVQNLTDPSTGTTTPMVTPNVKTQQEMAQGSMPKVTPEMAQALGDIGVQAGTPVPKDVYNSYLRLIEQRTKAPAKDIPRDVAQRSQIADQLGLKGSERTRYIATGQMSDPEASANRREGQQDRQDKQTQDRSDKSYQFNVNQLNSLEKPVADLNARFGRLRDTLAQGTPQADALVAPELLTVMAGGQGSGLRMNEAEIARIVGGRSNWEGLKAAINQWQLDPSKANTITPAQRQQIHALVDAVGKKLQAKQGIFDQAQQDLQATDDPKEHRRVVAKVRQSLTQVDNGGPAQLPQGGGKVIDPTTAQQFYQAAGGDPNKARQLATQNGWKVQ